MSRSFIAPLLALVAGVCLTAGASAAPRAPAGPVASLEPEATAKLWRSLVAQKPRSARMQQVECRPLRGVFYAASDWLRLATKLAASASPCAEYYISVPPLVADKTTFRRDQAWRIRALGPNFHASAEIHYATWSRWVQSTGNSWYTAGVTARERMAAAGYDVALGDTWTLNEFTSAVRRGDGSARTNVRELLRGLYDGDGTRPTRGAVLVIGFGQRTSDVSVYQSTLQSWLTDTAFWTDMAAYVSDWSQQVYGDLRAHAVPGVPVAERREYLNDYLQHKLVLAGAAPETVEPARTYLRDAYSALANGAWPRETAWGWTMVPAEQMAAYVSAQVNAMRHFSASSGQARDHWGFAWAPRNTTGLSTAEFGAQTGLILDRMGAAVRDSGAVVEPENPGSGACGPPGQDTLCAVDLADARHNAAWRSFRGWTQAALAIGNGAQTITAGVPSAAMTLTLATGTGQSITTGEPSVVSLRSSSPDGGFSTSTAGPWTSALTLTVAPRATATFYYRDTRAGRHTVTASAQGLTAGFQAVSVVAGPAAAIAVAPAASEVRARGTLRLAATATDAFGNTAEASAVAWRVRPALLGSLETAPGGAVTFTAGRLLRPGTITATSGAASGTATIRVVAGVLRVGSISFRPGGGSLRVFLATIDQGRRPVSATSVRVALRVDGRRIAVLRGRTGAAGKVMLRAPFTGGRCVTVTVTRAVAQGFRWNGRTPRNRICVR
ncbi:MAG TPA: hypothetical protein VMK83_05505 [Gaiellaceae bacterium]|nr:hypothetical protein [Gaiellaceae bacterium]